LVFRKRRGIKKLIKGQQQKQQKSVSKRERDMDAFD